MMIDQITQLAGARKRRKRVGRGESSGMGKTCGRGNKGNQSRSGGGARPLYEGGAMPLFRRLRKRGFSNYNFRTEYQVVNLATLEECFNAGDRVDVDALRKLHLVGRADAPVKILGAGELTKKLTCEVHAASGSAKAAIEKAGGALKLIAARDSAALWKAKRNTVSKATPAARAADPGVKAKRKGGDAAK